MGSLNAGAFETRASGSSRPAINAVDRGVEGDRAGETIAHGNPILVGLVVIYFDVELVGVAIERAGYEVVVGQAGEVGLRDKTQDVGRDLIDLALRDAVSRERQSPGAGGRIARVRVVNLGRSDAKITGPLGGCG